MTGQQAYYLHSSGTKLRGASMVSALRLGKSNRQIAVEFGLAEGQVARHVHRLLERMGVYNGSESVHLVDELVKHMG